MNGNDSVPNYQDKRSLMKIQHLVTLTIASAISLAMVNAGLGQAPTAGNSNQTIVGQNPCAGKKNPCASKNNPCAGKNPCASKNNPCAGKNPCASKNNPCAGKSSAKKGTKHPEIYTENGVALDGQDVVAYFTQNKPVQGNKNFTYNWKGATWQFSSAQNRDLFAKNPEKYAPQYGGYCAKAAADGDLATTVPTAWKIVNNKLYLNYNADAQKEWNQDIPGFIAKADKNWPAILNNDTLYR